MLTYIDVIPSKETISRTESLNILCGVANDSEGTTVSISLWGKADNEWKALITEETVIQDHEHKHLYYTLTPEMYSEKIWGEDIEELELCVSDRIPRVDDKGVMVFII